MGHHDGEPKECDIYVRDWPALEPMVLVKEIDGLVVLLIQKKKLMGCHITVGVFPFLLEIRLGLVKRIRLLPGPGERTGELVIDRRCDQTMCCCCC